jgi:hypothetical protein
MKKLSGVFLTILFCSAFVSANTDFYSDYTINNGTWTGNNFVHGSATLTVNGGNVSSISAFDNSTVNINGGTISTIYITNLQNATVNLYGGNLTTGFHGMFTIPNTINIYGKDFLVTQNGDNAYLSGKWADDSNFNFYFLRSNGLPDIVTLHTIPEPLTVSFFVLGTVFVKFRKLF